MPTRRNRLRSRKTQRQQRQRGGGQREIRDSAGELGPEFDNLQKLGIKKYRDLFLNKYWEDHGDSAHYRLPFNSTERHKIIPFGFQCPSWGDEYPQYADRCGSGVTCSSKKFFAPGQRKLKAHRCVPTFWPGTSFKEPYEKRRWYEEDNWYLEPKIVEDPEFHRMIIDEFKKMKILNDSFDALSAENQGKILKTELEKRYGAAYTGKYADGDPAEFYPKKINYGLPDQSI